MDKRNVENTQPANRQEVALKMITSRSTDTLSSDFNNNIMIALKEKLESLRTGIEKTGTGNLCLTANQMLLFNGF